MNKSSKHNINITWHFYAFVVHRNVNNNDRLKNLLGGSRQTIASVATAAAESEKRDTRESAKFQVRATAYDLSAGKFFFDD